MRQVPLLLRLRLSAHAPSRSSAFSHATWRAFIVQTADPDHLQQLSPHSHTFKARTFKKPGCGQLRLDLDVGMVLAGGAPLPCASLLFAVLVELGVAQDGHPPALVHQGHGRHAIQTLLVCGRHRQHHGHRQVDDATWGQQGWRKRRRYCGLGVNINTSIQAKCGI